MDAKRVLNNDVEGPAAGVLVTLGAGLEAMASVKDGGASAVEVAGEFGSSCILY